ncbi:YgdI/YgdR family lipoprotein [Salibacterium aidingense]|uniref:hypothetical protein n=1 Tax=Salibacterium aidingense TaxID=384933 RepID=UPI0004272006|nr:hypothetical protein [Salibacterium aidingense]
MKSFKVLYYLEKEFTIARVIHAETAEDAIQKVNEEEGMICFTSANGIYHQFHRNDVKLIRLGQAVKRSQRQQQNVN